MNRTHLTGVLAFLAILTLQLMAARPAAAQAVPFFNATGTSFTPQIGIVYTGVINDVQAVVSADRKYVTLTMRPQSSTLLNLRQFTFQQGAGVVGAGGGMAAGAAGDAPQRLPSPTPATQPSILNRLGMTRVGG